MRSFKNYTLIEMLNFTQYSPELYSYFAESPTLNCYWYSGLYGIYSRGVGGLLQIDSDKRKMIENWNRENNGKIEKLHSGYHNHYLGLKAVLNDLKIDL